MRNGASQLAAVAALLFAAAVCGGCGDDDEGGDTPAPDAGVDGEDADGGGEDAAGDADAEIGDDVADDTADSGSPGEPCEPCTNNDECGGPDDLCIELPLEPNGVCGVACAEDADCPATYTCFDVGDEGARQCLPDALFCIDRCVGVACDAGTFCDNRTGTCELQLELCDVECLDSTACGGPDDQCLLLPTTGESMCATACDIEDPTSCPEGFSCFDVEEDGELLLCIPDSLTCVERCDGVVCDDGAICDTWTGDCAPQLGLCDLECDNSALCGGPDDICIAPGNEGDESFCATACESSFDCPLDFFCGALEERELGVCVPFELTCIDDRCDAVDCGDGANCDPRTGECVESELGLCDACGELDSPSCGGAFDLCLGLPEPGGVICSLDCSQTDVCPEGFECAQLSNTSQSACIPIGGDCRRCDGVECPEGAFCNPLTGECVSPPDACSETPCPAGSLCNPDTDRCEVVGEPCTYEDRLSQCFSVVRRCTATRPDSAGVCAQICNLDEECSAASPQCVGLAGVNEQLCVPDALGGPSTCGILAPRGAAVGQRCGEGLSGRCAVDAPTCIEDVEAGVAGFCSKACTDDAECGGEGTCQQVRGLAERYCTPINCLCLTGGAVPDGTMDLLATALDQHGLGRCSFVFDPNDFAVLDPETPSAPLKTDAVSGLVVQPLAGPDFASTLRRDLSTALASPQVGASMIVAAAGKRGDQVALRPDPFEIPANPNPLEAALSLFVEAAGGTFDVGDVGGDISAVPVELQDRLAQVLAAMAEVLTARQGVTDALGLDQAAIDILFNGAPYVFLPRPASVDALDLDDPDTLALLTDLDVASLAAATADLSASIEGGAFAPDAGYDAIDISLATPAGQIVIGGGGDSLYDGTGLSAPIALLVDVSGNDTYLVPAGATSSADNPVSVLIDFDGDDVYDYEPAADPLDQVEWLPSDDGGRWEPDVPRVAGHGPVSHSDRPRQGAGRLGAGVLYDLGAGADRYRSLRMSQGAGVLGVGLLVDSGGADEFEVEAFGQGAGLVGIGVLADLGGEAELDTYRAWHAAQGFGGASGVGVLVDATGPSQYTAEPATGSRDVLYFAPPDRGQSNLNLCQGAGAGLLPADDRALDRQATGGGIGVLADFAGDDTYDAGIFAQGAGRHWGAGFLIDEAGDDVYFARYGAQGGAERVAVGVFVDVAGVDTYDAGPDRILSLMMGAGTNFGAGIFIDVAGDDVYRVPNISAGAGFLNGAGVFADLDGVDQHEAIGVTTWGHALLGPDGSDDGNPRRDIPTLGLFVDAGAATDDYTRPDFDGTEALGNDSAWTQSSDPDLTSELGAGVDGEGATGFE